MFHPVHPARTFQQIPKPDGGSHPRGPESGLSKHNAPFNPALALLQGKLLAVKELQNQQIRDEFKRKVHAAAENVKKTSQKQ